MYMPVKEAERVLWSANFAQQISQPEFNVGLTPAQISAFTAVNGTLQAAWLAATGPTRGPVTIAAKNTAMREMRVMATSLVNFIQNTPTVTDSQREALKITVRKTNPTPAPVPESKPKIDVLNVDGHQFRLRLSDVDRPTSKARPPKTIGVNLYSFAGEVAPMDVQSWKSEGTATKPTEVTVTIDQSVEPGTTVWFTAYWFNARGSGPATDPVSATIQFGGLSKGNILSAEPKARKAA